MRGSPGGFVSGQYRDPNGRWQLPLEAGAYSLRDEDHPPTPTAPNDVVFSRDSKWNVYFLRAAGELLYWPKIGDSVKPYLKAGGGVGAYVTKFNETTTRRQSTFSLLPEEASPVPRVSLVPHLSAGTGILIGERLDLAFAAGYLFHDHTFGRGALSAGGIELKLTAAYRFR